MATRDLNFPDNSVSGRNAPQDQVTQVVSTPATRVGSPASVRISNEVRSISSNLFEDVLLPAVKTGISDFLTNAVEMLFWGSSQDGRRGNSRGRRRSYNTMYNGGRSRYTPTRPQTRVAGRSLHVARTDDIFFADREDAATTLSEMIERIAEYDWCTVGDLYNLVGISSLGDHTLERYGWDNLDNARLVRDGRGYRLDLPEPIYN